MAGDCEERGCLKSLKKSNTTKLSALALLLILIWGQSCHLKPGNVSIAMVMWQKFKESVIDIDINVTRQFLVWGLGFPLFQKEFLVTFVNLCCLGPLRSSVLKRGVHNKSQRYGIQGRMTWPSVQATIDPERTNLRNQNISSKINTQFHYFSKER